MKSARSSDLALKRKGEYLGPEDLDLLLAVGHCVLVLRLVGLHRHQTRLQAIHSTAHLCNLLPQCPLLRATFINATSSLLHHDHCNCLHVTQFAVALEQVRGLGHWSRVGFAEPPLSEPAFPLSWPTGAMSEPISPKRNQNHWSYTDGFRRMLDGWVLTHAAAPVPCHESKIN